MCVSPAEKISSAIPSWETTSVTSAFFNQSALIIVKLTRVGISGALVDSDNEQIFKLARMIYYVDPEAVGTMGFLGNKERIQIPINSKHSSLEALKGS